MTLVLGRANSFTVSRRASRPATRTRIRTEAPTSRREISFVDNGTGTATLAGTPADGTFGTYPFTITVDNGIAPAGTHGVCPDRCSRGHRCSPHLADEPVRRRPVRDAHRRRFGGGTEYGRTHRKRELRRWRQPPDRLHHSGTQWRDRDLRHDVCDRVHASADRRICRRCELRDQHLGTAVAGSEYRRYGSGHDVVRRSRRSWADRDVHSHVSRTAPATGSMIGTVAFTDNAAPIAGCAAVPVSAGLAICSVIYPLAGAHSIVAAYSGDADDVASTAPTFSEAVQPDPTVTTVTSGPDPSTVAVVRHLRDRQSAALGSGSHRSPSSSEQSYSHDGPRQHCRQPRGLRDDQAQRRHARDYRNVQRRSELQRKFVRRVHRRAGCRCRRSACR